MKQVINKVRALKLSLSVAVIAGTLLYLYGATISQSLVSYFIQLPALVLLAVVSLARVNDIGPDRTTWPWQVRRMGLALVGVGAVSLIFVPFYEHTDLPTWRTIALTWGFALSWLTTPGLPPFWKYISGERDLPKSMT